MIAVQHRYSGHLGMKGVLLFAAMLFAAAQAHAGRPCEERPATPQTVGRALDLALRTREQLDESGATLALIARAGQDLSRWGLHYSHMGFVWRDHPKGQWTVVHELNECGTATSEIYDEGLGNFFLDDLWRMEAVILVPPPAMQQRLAAILAGGKHVPFHQPQYSMVAYPFSTRYQNSNQWTLEVLAMASARDVSIDSREQAQSWLKMAGYEPKELKLDAFTRLGARMTRANVAFDDHPNELRYSDRIRTVTVDSVLRFVERRDPDARRIEIAAR